MYSMLHLSGVAAATIAVAAFAPSAVAQDSTSMWTCQYVGNEQPEPLGDREGHFLTVGLYTCRIDGGPLNGGVATGTDIWEWAGPKGVELSDSGVVRKPGATAAYSGGTGTATLTMADGKVTGWTGSGSGKWLLGTGAWASLLGKSGTWTAKTTGPMGQFSVDAKFE